MAIGAPWRVEKAVELEIPQLFQKRGENALVVVAAAMFSGTGITE